MKRETNLSLLQVSGSAFECGQAIGRARAGDIRSCLDDWRGTLASTGVGDVDDYLARFLRETRFRQTILDVTPELLAEVDGMADGAEVDRDLLFVAQLMDEEWAFRSRILGSGVDREKCSSVAIAAEQETFIGQNMDLGGYTDGHQVVTLIQRSGAPGALMFSISSMIGLMGINDRGVGVCVNSLPDLPAEGAGLPVAFVIRHALLASSAAEASDRLKQVSHATGQHYVVADANGASSWEASPAGVESYVPPDPSIILHTNHPLTGAAANAGGGENSVARLQTLQQRLQTRSVTASHVKNALSSRDHPQHPVSRLINPEAKPNTLTGMIGFTTGSMVSAIPRRKADIISWVSAGPPSEVEYREYRLALC